MSDGATYIIILLFALLLFVLFMVYRELGRLNDITQRDIKSTQDIVIKEAQECTNKIILEINSSVTRIKNMNAENIQQLHKINLLHSQPITKISNHFTETESEYKTETNIKYLSETRDQINNQSKHLDASYYMSEDHPVNNDDTFIQLYNTDSINKTRYQTTEASEHIYDNYENNDNNDHDNNDHDNNNDNPNDRNDNNNDIYLTQNIQDFENDIDEKNNDINSRILPNMPEKSEKSLNSAHIDVIKENDNDKVIDENNDKVIDDNDDKSINISVSVDGSTCDDNDNDGDELNSRDSDKITLGRKDIKKSPNAKKDSELRYNNIQDIDQYNMKNLKEVAKNFSLKVTGANGKALRKDELYNKIKDYLKNKIY